MSDQPCTCPHNDNWMCIEGRVYGPCSSPNCGGVCEPEGSCDCHLHATDPNHDAMATP